MAFWTYLLGIVASNHFVITPPQLLSLPFARGNKIFTTRLAAGGGGDFCVQDGPRGIPRILVPATEPSLDTKYPFEGFAVSDDGRLCAFFLKQSNPFYDSIKVIRVDTGQSVENAVQWTHLGDFGWNGKGFYYGGYREPEDGSSSYSDERVLYHRLGTAQSQDLIVYEDKDHAARKYQFLTTFDHRFLILHKLERVEGKRLASEWFRREGDLQGKFTAIQESMAAGRSYLCDNVGDHLIFYTQYKSPGGRIIDVDTKHPEEENWKTVLPEPVDDGEPVLGELAMLSKLPGGGNQLRLYSYSGTLEKVIPTDTGTTTDIQFCRKGEKYAFVSVEKGGVKGYFIYDPKANKLVPFQ